jgi:hypothetical protein
MKRLYRVRIYFAGRLINTTPEWADCEMEAMDKVHKEYQVSGRPYDHLEASLANNIYDANGVK